MYSKKMTTLEILQKLETTIAMVDYIERIMVSESAYAKEVESESPDLYEVFGDCAPDFKELPLVKKQFEEDISNLGNYLLDKTESIVRIITDTKAKVAGLEAEKSEYQKVVNSYNSKIRAVERLDEYLRNTLLQSVLDKFGERDSKGRFIVIDGRKCREMFSEAVEVQEGVDLSMLPEDLVKVEYSPIKKMIKEALKMGKEFDGIFIKKNKRIQIY
jgi:hypothetical protein